MKGFLEARPVSSQRPMTGGSEELTHLDMNLNGNKNDTVYLKREKQASPCLHQPKHPHGNTPPTPTHPHSAAHRAKTYGNDNSSVNRQTRGQSGRPDPVPGAPYAGASSQRMGSAMLRKFHQQTVVKSNGEVCNKPAGEIRYGPPTPFLSPLQQEFAKAYDQRSTSLVKFAA